MQIQNPVGDPLQQHVVACGQKLLDAVKSHPHNGTSAHKWLDLLLSKTCTEADFRIQALRFIDVLPSLNDDLSLAQHLQEYFAGLELPKFAEWGLRHSDTPWATKIAAPTVRYSLRGLARQFMGGSQQHHAMTSISRLRHQNMNFTLDLLGEATISEVESDAYQQQYLNLLDSLATPVENWGHNDLLDISQGPSSPRLNLSLKLSSLYSQINPLAIDHSINAICHRLRPILRKAMEQNAFITIDMEQYDYKTVAIGCFKTIIMEDEFLQWPHIGIALQAYLKDTYDDILNLIDLIQQRGTAVSVRLVRGAYWDYETVLAKQNNWTCPVWQNKNDTDINYEKCLNLLLEHNVYIHTAIATHNPRSIAFAMAMIEQLKLQPQHYEFQMLFGMANSLKHALVHLGYRLRVYVPFGDTLPGMAYLVRRLLENSSGQSLIESGFSQTAQPINIDYFNKPIASSSHLQLTSSPTPFTNTALLRFLSHEQCHSFSSTLHTISQTLSQDYHLIIDGKHIETPNTIESVNPAHPDTIIGRVSSAEHQHADLALAAANKAFINWKQTSVLQRADYLRRVALILQQRRLEFAAIEILETGKNWHEADADICEAIDFLRYYAYQAEQLFMGQSSHINGEDNYLRYRPRGVSLIIPPWNFPLAILCGMLSAALVCGNTCILKPSSQTPVIAALFMQCWHEVGLPDGVINFLPGPGKIVGEYLARKPDIHIIAFTGSLQVGIQLINIASQIQPSQHHIKKVIAEMGGKNAIIIDSDADLDDAVLGTLQSAFGFQGQKCSAASRVIVVGKVYDRFLTRLLEASRSLNMGDPCLPHNIIGPIIDKASCQRIHQAIEHAKQFATYHPVNISTTLDEGYYIQPCIFTDIDPNSPLAQEEIFGPVLSVFNVDTFEQAVELANNSRYALTGGVYSRQPSHLEYAKEYFDVGNLYINRKITGALVERQPFGGHKMSGTGNKTGSADYLLQFVDSINITENTLRRGFAPDPDDYDS